MLTSIATVSLSGPLDRKLAVIAEAGFGGVEIFENDLLGFDGDAGDVGRMILDLGLICTCYQPFRDFEGLTGAARARAFARAEAKFDVMQALGAELMLVCSSVHPDAGGDMGRIVDDFRELGDRANARGLRIGYEALAWGRFINDHRQSWEIVKRAAHASVGLILDSFHSLARKIPSATLADIDANKIFLMQIADAPEMPVDYLYWSRHFRCFPSQGDLPLAGYVAAALRQGYRGPLSLEIFNDRFREWSARQIAADGHRSLLLLQDQAGVAPPLPAAIDILGVDFIEFAVNADELAALEQLLTRLGFSHVGTHRSKQVTLWQQGDIHAVLNADAVGWAHAHRQIHGTSFCAIALCVDSARAALDRAASLDMETFEQSPAEGELAIPWIRGVGGALTYFTEPDRNQDHWTHDFHWRDGSQAALPPPVALRIDHFSQVMPMAELLSWQLYYTSLFNVVKGAPVEFADTSGLVQSQPIESADAGFRVTLNASIANETLAGRFMQGTLGAGVQHIAFETPDIFMAARNLMNLGLEILPVPPNYFDDVRARFGLAEELVAQLRMLNIFYDRDAGGEYFHFYSRAFNKRFFFEIVQRRGYRGYGVANAGVRLAAQARYKTLQLD